LSICGRDTVKDMTQTYDVVVVGGGAAGLAGALTLARARRNVLLLDAGEQRNRPAAGVHSYLTRDGIAPADLVATGVAEVQRYGGEVRSGRAVSARRLGPHVELTLDDGSTLTARRLLVATGVTDELPDLPGVAELWGRDVLHCPYCHGWETRDRAVGVLGRGPASVHQALLFRQWSGDLRFFSHRMDLPDEDRERLEAFGITVVPGEVERLLVENGRLAGVQLVDGTVVQQEAVVISTKLVARSQVLESLGLPAADLSEDGHVVGSSVAADADGRTEVPGVWVAGNVTDLAAQVMAAAASGVRAAASLNADLVDEDVEAAVRERRRRSA